MAAIAEPVRSELRSLLRRLDEIAAALVEQESQQLIHSRNYDTIRTEFGFRERYFGGRFGGNKQKVADWRELATKLAGIEQSINEQNRLKTGIVEQYHTLVRTELCKQEMYRTLFTACDNGEAARKAAHNLLQYIAAGINAVAASDYIATQEAKNAIERINAYLPIFKDAVACFQRDNQTLRDLTDLDGFLVQLDIVDLTVDFGFGDFLQMDELRECAENLRAMETQVETAKESVLALLKSLQDQRDTIVFEATRSI